MVRNIYIYVKKNLVDKCLKYGMKLSDHSNMILKINNSILKNGIHAYFTPRDCILYNNDEYTILRISVSNNDLRVFTFNNDDVNNKTTEFDNSGYNNIYDNNNNNNDDNYNLKKEIIQINNLNFEKVNNNNLINLNYYTLGDFEYPELLISSSIMPENIFVYNKILDVPLMFTTSNEFYNQKKEETFVQENLNVTNFSEIIN